MCDAKKILSGYGAPLAKKRLFWTLAILSVTVIGYSMLLSTILFWQIAGVILAGNGLWGLWTLGHDCLHGAFHRNSKINEWLGAIFLIPTLFPFQTTKYLHLGHHAHLNNAENDTAWNPWPIERWRSSPTIVRKVYFAMRTWAWWLGPLMFLITRHFDFRLVESSKKKFFLLNVGLIALYVYGVVAVIDLVYDQPEKVVILLLPHLWFSFVFAFLTLMQHTNPRVLDGIKWYHSNLIARKMPIEHTVDYKFPKVVEILLWYGNIHSPHHIAPGVPFYRLKEAKEALQENSIDIYETPAYVSDLLEVLKSAHVFDTNRAEVISIREAEFA